MEKKIKAAPTIVYPESDGEPMAETDRHRDLMMAFIFMLKDHFEDVNDVYVSGNLLMYYEEGNIRKSVVTLMCSLSSVSVRKSGGRIGHGRRDTPLILCWKSRVQARIPTI